MVKIVWTEQSVVDLKDIFDYISKNSRHYAEDQIRRIKTKTLILKTQPESGRIVPELGIVQKSVDRRKLPYCLSAFK